MTPSPTPNRWALRSLLTTAFSLAVLVLALSALVFWVGSSVLRLGLAETQTLAFLWLVFSSQATIYVTRVRSHFWTFPPDAGCSWARSWMQALSPFWRPRDG